MSEREPQQPGLRDVMSSVFRAGLGVQSDAARTRDFSSGNARPFIVVGILFTVVLVLAVVITVRLVLAAS